jgi:hypothetical protein
MSPVPPPDPADDIRRLLHDTVDDVEPGHGLDAIRSRTKEDTMSRSSRPWIWGVGGAVVATAATIAAVALAGNLGDDRSDDPEPAAAPTSRASEDSSGPDEESTAPSASAEPSPTAREPEPTAIPVYWAGESPQGLRLYREFQTSDGTVDEVTAAARAAVSGTPLDPDYRSAWPDGSGVETTDTSGESTVVDLTGVSRTRPAGMSAVEAQMAVEQVIWTVQAARGEGRGPVELRLDGGRTDQVLGVPASEPLANGDPLSTLSLVNVTTPEQNAVVSGTFEASGLASSFEATVPWEIRRGDEVVQKGFSTAEGWMDNVYPWSTRIDVSKLPAGDYTFVALTDDPSGGAEGPGPFSDTKAITVE